jgi:hypothetical protein
MPAEGDVRAWVTLPGEVQVLVAHLEPGDHEITVSVRDKSGVAMLPLSRTLHVNVREGRLAFAWARAAPAEVVQRTPSGEGRMEGSR